MIDAEDIDLYISSARQIVDKAILDHLDSDAPQSEIVGKAARYTVENGGHRWRPLLLLVVGRIYGVPDHRLLPMAIVTELLHTAAMILDDLPSMDDAPIRHGRSTCHRVFGEGITILASHFLLNICFEIVRTRYGSASLAELTQLLGDMIGGQAADLALQGQVIGSREEELERVYRLKSGRLFAFSARMGAALGDAPAPEIRSLDQFGETLGLAYQVLGVRPRIDLLVSQLRC